MAATYYNYANGDSEHSVALEPEYAEPPPEPEYVEPPPEPEYVEPLPEYVEPLPDTSQTPRYMPEARTQTSPNDGNN